MTFKNNAGIGVFNNYGKRDTGNAVGLEQGTDSGFRLSVNLTGQMLNDGFVPPVVVPKGALFRSATLRVDEAFALGGTTPTIRIGAAGSVATNGVVITEAQAETVGTKALAAGAGQWAFDSTTGTTAAAKVAIDMGGTNPTSTNGGKAVLVLEFFNKAKA